MLTVACVYRPGGGFSDDYVYRLKAAVEKHSFVHDRFVCLTNQPIEKTECIKFRNNWPGWWSKIELFRPGLFTGRVAYFDLDTMLVSDVSDIISDTSEFLCGTNWKSSNPTHINSAVMVWNADNTAFGRIYNHFNPRDTQKYERSWDRWGDQGYIQDELPVPFTSMNEKYPGRVVSYKIDIRHQGFVPKEASIVCFHGRPRPAQLEWTLPARA